MQFVSPRQARHLVVLQKRSTNDVVVYLNNDTPGDSLAPFSVEIYGRLGEDTHCRSGRVCSRIWLNERLAVVIAIMTASSRARGRQLHIVCSG
jgi:hypothetical protein